MTGAALVFALSGVASKAAAAGLIPSAGEIVRKGTLLDGPCSYTPPPAADISHWGTDKNGTPYIGMDVHTEFHEVDSQGEVSREPVGSLSWFSAPEPAHCSYEGTFRDGPKHGDGIKAVDRGIWLMRVHRVRINKVFEFTGGWVPAAGDGTDAATDIRFDVVGPNTCGNSAWVGLGPTDPACLRDQEKKQAADMAKWEQHELQIAKPDYLSMCGVGKINPQAGYQSGQAGACIGYELSIKSEQSDMQANQRLANDPPNPDYMTIAVPKPTARPELSKLPPAWTAYRAVLTDLDWVAADTWALVTAVERANGAYAATAKSPAADQWTQRQNQACHQAMNDAVDRVGDAQNNLPQARSELIAAGIPEDTVDKLIGAETRQVTRADALIELLR